MTSPVTARDLQGRIFDVDTFATHDGPGIRMAVYLKGCPLACKWCHSPESRRAGQEIIFMEDRCRHCGTCVQVCAHGVHRMKDEKHVVFHSRCQGCGACIANCPAGALALVGHRVSAGTIIDKAVRLKPFFAHSGGGVTLSGGEVTRQPQFAAAILAGCHQAGIHTAIETCGACPWDHLALLLPHTDLVLYDLKCIDDRDHQRWTEFSNQQILENAARLADYHARVQIRIPLIPGATDTEANLRGIFAFMRGARLSRAALMPYNPSAAAKYEWLGLPYELTAEAQTREHLKSRLALARGEGIEAVIG